MYTQLFNLLCTIADDEYHGKLPVHVRCILDEFANIGQIPKFDKLIATIRSREISASIILQSKAQLKSIYKDNAETIEGNCDTFLFLGGKEKSTLKDLSEVLGKETIDTYNTSDTRGTSQSYGLNYQKLGRELMSQDRLALMDGGKCILQAIALVKLGADITATQGLDRETVMHVAVKTGNLELVKCLIQAGADAEVTSRSGETPLERAFHWARTFDLIKLAPVAEYLIGIGVPVTDKIRTYMRSAAEDIEFRRKDMSPDIMPELDRAMESLYGLLGVASVPRRVEYDGTSPIVIHEKRWQKQHGELWNLLVPGSGHAGTVQGEVIRISGKLAYEILDNGCCNWDSDFKSMANALYRYICMGTPLDVDEQREFAGLINGIKDADETDINRLTELSVKWVTLNLNPMAVGELDYKR